MAHVWSYFGAQKTCFRARFLGAFGSYFGGLGGSWRALGAILAHLGPKRVLKSAPEAPHPRYGGIFGGRFGDQNLILLVKNSPREPRDGSESDFLEC